MLLKALVFILVALTVCLAIRPSPCPIQNQIGSVISVKVTISQKVQSIIPLDPEEDVQCYNYSLPYEFTKYPEVTVGTTFPNSAIHDFQAESTNHLFLSIKTIPVESLSYVSFIIRTPWRYTNWQKISFSFLAEDRKDIEVGSVQIDPGKLGGCQMGKNINAVIPFKNIGLHYASIQHNIFLTGFQISSRRFTREQYSPLQIQIIQSRSNNTGIDIVISVTTISQVHAIQVSFVGWAFQTTLSIIHGVYMYEKSPGIDVSHTPDQNIGRNYARIHGITGFIINNKQQDLQFFTIWTGSKFHFDLDQSTPYTSYLSFEYIFFLGSECSDCPGYPLSYNHTCVQYCPLNTYATKEKVCIICGDSHFWNGTSCVKQCPTGQSLNILNNECECPAGMFWNTQRCISCFGGKIFNPISLACECPQGTRWNGFGCANMPECTNGKQWNVFTFQCQCPYQTFWNGNYCQKKVRCTGGQYRNMKNQCVCPQGTYLSNGWCQATGCIGGQIWNGTKCICQPTYNWNGSICLQCINGQVWNPRYRTCDCEKNYVWNGNYCEKKIQCSGGRVWNETYEQCICPLGKFWNGFTCMVKPNCCCNQRWNAKTYECQCPSSFHWDGSTCVLCINGKVWDSTSNKCVCRLGTQWNGEFCVVIQECYGGMIWNQNTWACQCPSAAVWNGNYCIMNPCIGGQVWDNSLRRCRCHGNKIFINNVCTPPEIVCTNGKIWNTHIYACQCPSGTFDDGTRCLPIPVCSSNKIRNPFNNKCECKSGLVWLDRQQNCADPTCPINQRWNGDVCVDIACPPNSYFNGTQCVCPDPAERCEPWEYYDGVRCVYQEGSCPLGTRWNGTTCSSNTSCPQGFYGYNNYCEPLPQKCIPPTMWNGNRCVAPISTCPHGSYLRNGICYPYVPCQQNQVWNQEMIKCSCPSGTKWNGNQCVGCDGGQFWDPFEGCKCPTGRFLIGSRCQRISNSRCFNIPAAFWDGSQCLCHQGYESIGLACHCQGVQRGNLCDRCAHRPNSEWRFGKCHCKEGFTFSNSECLPNKSTGHDTESDCSVGTFFDSQQRRCLPCPDGCLSCTNSYSCRYCKPEFNYNEVSEVCVEHCGDGKRFVSECDDGNNNNGDGCSLDCKIEPGYVCRGGSPSSPDSCIFNLPNQLTITQTGQIRYTEKIIINVKLDYLPKKLMQSTECQDSCSGILEVKIIDGDQGATSIASRYIPTSSFSFSVEIAFDRPYIGAFTVQMGVKRQIAEKYFGLVGANNRLIVEVIPSYLSKVSDEKEDILQ